MPGDPTRRKRIQQKIGSEMKEYTVMAGYFAFFLLSLTTYRKLILAEYEIGYFAYGAALVEALVLGKVVLIGEVLHLGRRFEGRPLIVATIWKSLIFALFAAALIAAEHVVVALVHGRPVASEFQFSGGHGDEMVARFQLMLVAFVPFFAFRDLARTAGLGELSAVLFGSRRGGATAPDSTHGEGTGGR